MRPYNINTYFWNTSTVTGRYHYATFPQIGRETGDLESRVYRGFFFLKQEEQREQRITFSRQVIWWMLWPFKRGLEASDPGKSARNRPARRALQPGGSDTGLPSAKAGLVALRKGCKIHLFNQQAPRWCLGLIWIIPASLKSINKYWLSAYCLPSLALGILGDAEWV